MGARNWAKHDAERDRLMQLVPAALPEEIDRWLIDVCLADHHYMFYDNRRGSDYRYCSRCQKAVDARYILKPQHKHPITCPQCNTEVSGVCMGRFKRNPLRSDNFQIRIMQRTEEGIVVRRFDMIRRCTNENGRIQEQLLWDEIQRVFNNGSAVKRLKKLYKFGNGGWHKVWNESRQQDFATHNNMGWVTLDEEYDYVDNIHETIAGTCFQYSKMAKRDHYTVKGNALDYFSGWIKPVEYLEKTGWDNLASDIIGFDTRYLKPTAKTIEKFLRLPKQHIAYAKQNNLNVMELEALRSLIRLKEPIPDVASLKRFSIYGSNFKTCLSLAPTLRLAEWMRYEPASTHSHLYHDYLKFCRDLGYDMSDRSILFPKDIRKAHDREMVRIEILAHQKDNEAIARRYQLDLTRHGFHAEGLLIRPPVDAEEIIREGSRLHHCVGTYIDKVAKEKTTILLVRRKDEPDEPFFTAEWNHDRLIQIRGDHNKPPTPEVAEFIKAWETRKKKTQKKPKQIAVMAAAAI